jgi:NADH:ubiquinone oxidoreductase subunit F (NADH-binding)
VIVANGTEGEPASRKDAALLVHDPDLVIDGVLAAAAAVGARDAVVVVTPGAGRAVGRIEEAVRRRTLDAGRVRLSVAVAPEGFVVGEESALVHWLNGGPATPTLTPPRPFERGVAGRPTLVQNVETLAHVALVARHGAAWFRRVGTEAEPGSMLVTIGGAVAAPGVREIVLGERLGDVLARAGGVTGPIGGVLVGGYFGSWLRSADPLALPFSRAGLAPAGGAPGAGAIVALPADRCGLVETARAVAYLARESAGQCGPCVFGLRDLARAAAALAAPSGGPHDLRDLMDLPDEIEGRGACAHPDGVARLVRSALAAFPEEIGLHLHGRCSAPNGQPVLPLPGAPGPP